MARKRQKYKPKAFESDGKSNDTSANVYESMLVSPAFIGMTKNQRLLYLYLKAQFYGKRKPKKDFPDVESLQDDTLFYFSFGMAQKYGLYTRGNKKSFYDDIHAVEAHGFIKTISNGKATKSKSIYQFIDSWQNWKPNKTLV